MTGKLPCRYSLSEDYATRSRIFIVLCVVCLLVGVLRAEDKPLFNPHGLILSLGGSGSAGTSVSGFGLNLGIAQTGNCVLPFQIGVRQTITYLDESPLGSQTTANTALFYNATLFTLFRHLDVAAGMNVAVNYGNTPLLWTVAPETGIR